MSRLHPNTRIGRVVNALWRNWAMSVGALMLPILLGAFLPAMWIPFICVAEAYVLATFMRSDLSSGLSACSVIVRLTIRILFITAAAMFIVAILCTDWLVPTMIYLEVYNSEIPFVTCLVLFPVTAFICATALYVGMGERKARAFQRRNGFFAGDSVVATLYYRESRYQLAVLMAMALVLGGVEYWYYYARYINTDFNDPDRYFFSYMPVALYLLSLLFMWGRYVSMENLYLSIEASEPHKINHTIVRFLLLFGDEILLHSGADGKWDTPAECVIPRCRAVTEPQAELLLSEQTGIENAYLRYCFTNDGFAEGSNIIHYAAFLGEHDAEEMGKDDTWFNAYMIDTAMRAGALTPVLANELYRIHTMTMAWKTYDREGKRRYPIKHYRPTFRIGDLREWNVDYDDHLWFDVAHNNEDKALFHSRKLWHRLTDIFRPKTSAPEKR